MTFSPLHFKIMLFSLEIGTLVIICTRVCPADIVEDIQKKLRGCIGKRIERSIFGPLVNWVEFATMHLLYCAPLASLPRHPFRGTRTLRLADLAKN